MLEYVRINPHTATSVGTRSFPLASAATTTAMSIVIPFSREKSSAFFMEMDEEREWESIVRKNHVKNALRRLAADALRQEAEKETEEGGFAVE